MAASSYALWLSTQGWKTKRPHRVQIWYVENRGRYYIVSEMGERSHWVQNIQKNPRVEVTIGKNEFWGTGRILDPEKDKEILEEVTKIMKGKYSWSEGTIIEVDPD
jgi:deazaflavin-dependent oxidoreductase (nitroreductase family)